MWAARNGHARVVELLLAAGADVAAKSNDGY
jgi:ankyrin repeat protein